MVLLACGTSQAQSLKLASLYLPADAPPGSWISYQVTVESKNRPPRRFTQRLAVVSREGLGEESGAWVELKRVESGKTRLERGFFARPEHGAESRDPASGATRRMRLARYQRLTLEGRLLEYSVGDEGAPQPDDDISAMDLLEFSGSASSDSLAPDTLRVGHRIIPCRVQRYRQYGNEDWHGDDTTSVSRILMTRTYYRNPAIPVTGYARSIVEVSTERVPAGTTAPGATTLPGVTAAEVPGDQTTGAAAPADSAGAPAPRGQSQGGQGIIYRAEVTLLDMGNDAVPEVTQAPETAPEEAAPRVRRVIK